MSSATTETVAPVVLPEGVGNADLDRLHEVVPPEAVAWTPQTIGWYLLVALLVVLAAWVAVRLRRRWVADRFRRQALAELARIERDLDAPESREAALRSLPALLKRTALAAAPRRQVASLAGADWLSFLDGGLGGSDFSTGDGRALAEIAFLPTDRLSELPDESVARLVALARRWIRRGA